MNEIIDLYSEFESQLNKNLNHIAQSNLLKDTLGDDYTLDMHYLVLERIFMNVYMQWEKLLEKTFLLYMTGKQDIQGNCYVRYAMPTNDEHAYNMVKGTRNYPDWTNLQDVILIAKIYFEDAGPYNLLLNCPIEFSEMKTIRNKISHMSMEADKKFKRLVNQKLANNQIDTVGKFLDITYNGTVTYFQHYTEVLLDYAKVICNKESEE